MSGRASWRPDLAERLVGLAAVRLRGRHPDWAAALTAELHVLPEGERLRWAAGCLGASFVAPGAGAGLAYPAALAAGVASLTLYQWRADEGLATLALIAALGLLLGLLRPERALVSGVAVGSVVAAVLAFETVSGLRPAYETRLHTLLQDLGWAVLVAPAVAAAAAGRLAARLAVGDPR